MSKQACDQRGLLRTQDDKAGDWKGAEHTAQSMRQSAPISILHGLLGLLPQANRVLTVQPEIGICNAVQELLQQMS